MPRYRVSIGSFTGSAATWRISFIALGLLLSFVTTPAAPATSVKNLDTPRDFPAIESRAQWEGRARQIREQVLVSCGLWPLPEKTALQAKVFGKIERDGYSIEKVQFQPWPGFYLAGNLYRPLGRGPGPFPAILNPHGHWKEGRMADNKDGSVAARCIHFARQGMIAFSYDMLGYNDTFFPDQGDVPVDKFYLRHRRFATNQVCLLWNISQMGLQTWNSVRALDFLESLPDVDRNRLACTGESGGGTQTFMLGAIDDRLRVQAPVVMVSHTMQGGCSCENAPGLRVKYSNMELAAAAVPRPQILVAATGDWTRATLTVEGPAIKHIYGLFDATEKFHYVRFDYNHNYNQTSREAVYDFFNRALLDNPAAASSHEAAYQKEPDADLRVWEDGKLPKDALTEQSFIESLIQRHSGAWEGLLPHDESSLERFKEKVLPAWHHTLQVSWPDHQSQSSWKPAIDGSFFRCASLQLKRGRAESPLSALYFTPLRRGASEHPARIVVIADASGGEVGDQSGKPTGSTAQLLQRGVAVLVIKSYSTTAPADQFANFYTTYNRTQLQERVADLLALCAQARLLAGGQAGRPQVILIGVGRAGLWTLLAAPGADAIVADCDHLDRVSDAELLAPDLFCPGIRNIGTFEGAAMLAAPHPLLLHHFAQNFPTTSLTAAYKAAKSSKKLRLEPARLADPDLVKWVASLK